MSKAPWKSKQQIERTRKEYTSSNPWAQLTDLFESRAVQHREMAETDGLISDYVRTIGVQLGVIPLPPIADEDGPDRAA